MVLSTEVLLAQLLCCIGLQLCSRSNKVLLICCVVWLVTAEPCIHMVLVLLAVKCDLLWHMSVCPTYSQE